MCVFVFHCVSMDVCIYAMSVGMCFCMLRECTRVFSSVLVHILVYDYLCVFPYV